MTTHPEQLLARAGDGALTDAEQRDLQAHLDGCAACRDALEAQRLVSRTLVARDAFEPAPGFANRVSARLDRQQGGILDLANWRAWTVGLAPVAAGLVFAAYLGIGTTTTSENVTTTPSDAATFESWASASAGTTPAAVFLQPSSYSSDQLLEAVLTGAAPSTSRETPDVR